MVKLVLIRHGQSIWNLQNRFTGWADISLSQKGIKEAKKAAKKLNSYKFDIAFTSNLLRAQETLFEILNSNQNCNHYIRIHENESKKYSHYIHTKKDDLDLKVYMNKALNERYYGDLQGLNKDDTKKKFGEKLVQLWRRSFKKAPPGGNALSRTYKRVIPYFKSHIEKELKNNKNIIISAHGNSLRAIIMYLENISGDDIQNIELKTGQPIVYTLNKDFKILDKQKL